MAIDRSRVAAFRPRSSMLLPTVLCHGLALVLMLCASTSHECRQGHVELSRASTLGEYRVLGLDTTHNEAEE